jgi:hypothetical protein
VKKMYNAPEKIVLWCGDEPGCLEEMTELDWKSGDVSWAVAGDLSGVEYIRDDIANALLAKLERAEHWEHEARLKCSTAQVELEKLKTVARSLACHVVDYEWDGNPKFLEQEEMVKAAEVVFDLIDGPGA